MQRTEPSAPSSASLGPVALGPVALGPVTLRNRFIKTATYEGMSPGGVPSPALTRHHRELARGGVGLTTVAYCAVSDAGRTFGDQLLLEGEALPRLAELTKAVHDEGGHASLQLGHAGGFSKHRAGGRRASVGPSPGLNPYGVAAGMPLVRALTKPELEGVASDFVSAARRAVDVGFDAVELHLGHGYLLSQFLSPKKNRRTDDLGGSIEGRMRFPLEVVRRVLDAVGTRAAVLVKTNLDDGVPGGLGVDECTQVVRALEREGVHAAILSGGLVDASAFYLLRGGRPLSAMVDVERSRLQKAALRLFGALLVREVPYEPTFFLDLARRVRAATRLPLVYLGGVASGDDVARVFAEGFELVALGRALLHDPGFVKRLMADPGARSPCTHCNACVAEMDRPGGVVCVLSPEQLVARAREVAASAAASSR